jgi:hypothetical protein
MINTETISAIEQLKEEILKKHKSLCEFYRDQETIVDDAALGKLLGFLLGTSEDLPKGVVLFDPVRKDIRSFKDIEPDNVTHLVWQLISLCRASATRPFFRNLAVGDNQELRPWEANIMGRLLQGCLFFMLPEARTVKQWQYFRIPAQSGQNLGFALIDRIEKTAPLASDSVSYPLPPVILYEEQILETASSQFIGQLRRRGIVPADAHVLVFLYSSRNLAYYLSGVLETIRWRKSTQITSNEQLHALRRAIQSNLRSTSRSDANVPLPLFKPGDSELMLEQIDVFAAEIHRTWDYMFEDAYRKTIVEDPGQTIGSSLVASIHLRLPHVGAFLWNLEGHDLVLERGHGYNKEGPLPDEFVLDDIAGAKMNLPGAGVENAPARLQAGDSTPKFEQFNWQSRGPYPPELFRFANNEDLLRPKSRIQIPLLPPDPDTFFKRGLLELYFNEDGSALQSQAGQIRNFIARALVNGAKYAGVLESRRRTIRSGPDLASSIKAASGLLGQDTVIGDLSTHLVPYCLWHAGISEDMRGNTLDFATTAILFEGEYGSGKSRLCDAVADLFHSPGTRLSTSFGPDAEPGTAVNALKIAASEFYEEATKKKVVVILVDDLIWPNPMDMKADMAGEWARYFKALRECIEDSERINADKAPTGDIANEVRGRVKKPFCAKIMWLFARNLDEEAGIMPQLLKEVLTPIKMQFPRDFATRRLIVQQHLTSHQLYFTEPELARIVEATMNYTGRQLLKTGFVQFARNKRNELTDRAFRRHEPLNIKELSHEIVEAWLSGASHASILQENLKKIRFGDPAKPGFGGANQTLQAPGFLEKDKQAALAFYKDLEGRRQRSLAELRHEDEQRTKLVALIFLLDTEGMNDIEKNQASAGKFGTGWSTVKQEICTKLFPGMKLADVRGIARREFPVWKGL